MELRKVEKTIRDSFINSRLRRIMRLCQQCYERYNESDEDMLGMDMSMNESHSTYDQDWA